MSSSEKVVDVYEIAASKSRRSTSFWSNLYSRFAQWREELNLPDPGTVESLQKEVKSVHLANYAFDGGRADLNKSLSINPAFQVSHSFHLGSQVAPSSYNFSAIFLQGQHFMQGNVDHEANVSGRYNFTWTPYNITKLQAQLSSQAGHNVIQFEQDYSGRDYSLNAKIMNPWPTDLTGIVMGSYLQSITKNIAIGMESLFQRPNPSLSEFTTSYIAKYTSSAQDWIATMQLQPAGLLQATYWHKLSEKVEAAADLQLSANPMRRDALATLGVKYDLRMAQFRAQVDSTGKITALLEQQFLPSFLFRVSGEIDHYQDSAKFGVGIMLESSTLTPEEMEAMEHSSHS